MNLDTLFRGPLFSINLCMNHWSPWSINRKKVSLLYFLILYYWLDILNSSMNMKHYIASNGANTVAKHFYGESGASVKVVLVIIFVINSDLFGMHLYCEFYQKHCFMSQNLKGIFRYFSRKRYEISFFTFIWLGKSVPLLSLISIYYSNVTITKRTFWNVLF